MVMYSGEAVHYSEQFYKDPEIFDPHRFDGAESNTLQDWVSRLSALTWLKIELYAVCNSI